MSCNWFGVVVNFFLRFCDCLSWNCSFLLWTRTSLSACYSAVKPLAASDTVDKPMPPMASDGITSFLLGCAGNCGGKPSSLSESGTSGLLFIASILLWISACSAVCYSKAPAPLLKESLGIPMPAAPISYMFILSPAPSRGKEKDRGISESLLY